jgi:hypothetical protein
MYLMGTLLVRRVPYILCLNPRALPYTLISTLYEDILKMGVWPPLSTPILGPLFEYASTLRLYPKL